MIFAPENLLAIILQANQSVRGELAELVVTKARTSSPASKMVQ